MEKTTPDPADVPTALPGVEEDDAREKLLLENASDEIDDTADEETDDTETKAAKPNKRRRQVIRSFGAFAVFVCLLVFGISWFFGMGWFSKPQTQAVNRSAQRDAPAAPVSEDEKLKMALGMVAPTSTPAIELPRSNGSGAPIEIDPTSIPAKNGDVDVAEPKTSRAGTGSYSLPPPENTLQTKPIPAGSPNGAAVESGNGTLERSKVADSDETRGRSLFFGIPKAPIEENRTKVTEPVTLKPVTRVTESSVGIPFGTMLPVRLVGSIYTLRNSRGFVRMELTRPVEEKGYSYPGGTLVLGNVRGGESVRAFVDIVGLIDPVSGEFVKFNGELLGTDGASGIEGKRRNLTSQWSRFFQGMKDTAASVLGSVGSLRSGGTVVLSEPMRRGTESMSEDLGGVLFKNGRETTFLEVAAGSNGYILVTGVPDNSATPSSRRDRETAK